MDITTVLCGEQVRGLTVASQSSVIGVGVGLFLGLTALQVVGSGGMAALRRKAQSLRDTVNANRLAAQRAKVGHAEAELLRLEIELGSLSRTLFVVAAVLLVFSLGGLAYSSIWPQTQLSCISVWSIVGYYLALPVLLFLLSAEVIRRKSRSAATAVKDCEQAVFQALNGR